MPEISTPDILKTKRPAEFILDDLDKYNVTVSEDELKTYPIVEHFAKKLGISSNIPELYKHVFEKSVMVQILDPFTNRYICVGDEGQKVNTQPIGKDYDCNTCEHFIVPNSEHPNGQCSWAYARFKERFGDERPEGLDDMVKASLQVLEGNDHEPLSIEEVKQIGEQISE